MTAIIVIWQLMPRSVFPSYVIARPAPVAKALWDLISSGRIVPHLLVTTASVAIGVGLGGAIGIALALCNDSSRIVRWILEPIMTLGNAVPKVGMVAFLVLIVGLNSRSHVYLLVMVVVFVFYYNTVEGMRNISAERRRYFGHLAASRLKSTTALVLPSLTNYILSAVRIAIPLAYGAQVFAELEIPTDHGLGSPLLSGFAQSLDSAGAIAVIVVLGVLGYLIDIVLGRLIDGHISRTGGRSP